MREITVYDLSDKPVCVDCRHVITENRNGYLEVGCAKFIISSGRDLVTGEDRLHHQISADSARLSEVMCGLDARWYEMKA